jgi:hypothetical protein
LSPRANSTNIDAFVNMRGAFVNMRGAFVNMRGALKGDSAIYMDFTQDTCYGRALVGS